jgi:hypothetical protein
MKMIRYLLSHIVLILMIVAVIMAYYYRDQLFSQHVNARIDDAVTRLAFWRARSPQQSVESQAPAPGATPQVAASEPGKGSGPTEVTTVPVPDDEQVATAQDGGTSDSPAMEGEGAEAPSEDNTADEQHVPEVAQAGASDASQPAASVAENRGGSGTTDSADNESDSEQSVLPGQSKPLLREARLAYQRNALPEAEQLYQQLIEIAPEDPNAYGELGNVYYVQGQWEQAGEAYYQAAMRLLDAGQTSQVEYLLRIIQGLSPARAKKLQNRLAGQQPD